jgi:hypothetical protein
MGAAATANYVQTPDRQRVKAHLRRELVSIVRSHEECAKAVAI